MKHLLTMTVASFAITATSTLAGGIERSSQSVGILFEKGNYAELSFSFVSPTVSGVGAGTTANAAQPTPGAASGNMVESYNQIGLSYKHQFNDTLSAAIIYDTPFGADVLYPASSYFNTGAQAEINSSSFTGLVKYTTATNVSAFAGLRYQTMEATAQVPIVDTYTVTAEDDSGTGFVLGAAYEKPEIALRVALTYNSGIEHSSVTTETTAIGGTVVTNTDFETPKSMNLEFQSGVAANTLVFGSVRWVDWSNFNLTPAVYLGATGSSIVSYQNDTTTFNIGVGRKFSDAWSGALSLGYEKSHGGFSANLGPTDGNVSVGLGGSYTTGNMKISAGVRYVAIGDAQTELGGSGIPAADFTNNNAIAAGVKVGFNF